MLNFSPLYVYAFFSICILAKVYYHVGNLDLQNLSKTGNETKWEMSYHVGEFDSQKNVSEH